MTITSDNLDITSYDAKFEWLDNVLSKEVPTKSDYKEILSDATKFAYFFLKNPNGGRLKLFPYQDIIINDTSDRIYFRAANQLGKSALFNVKAVFNLFVDHGHAHNEAIVSKSLPQSIFQMRRIKSLLNSMRGINWKESKGSADSMSVISVDVKDKSGKVKYTNMLVCAPCTEGLLGYDLHELNLDEFEYWEVDCEYFYTQIAQPRTYATKGRIMVMSNPNGQDHFGATLEQQTLKGTNVNRFSCYVFNYLDRPGNTKEEYEQLKHELSRQQFESTVAAIRSHSDKCYFTPEEIEGSLDKDLTELKMVGKQSFFFLDVGSKHDQSVLIGGYIEYPNGEEDLAHIYMPIIHVYPVGYPISMVVGARGDEDVEQNWHYEKSVREYIIEWSGTDNNGNNTINPVFGVDVTGNSGISPLFESVGIFPEDITFSGPVKSAMYQRYKYFMEKGLLHRVKSKDWEYQARHLVMQKSVRGYLMVHHENESDLDDTQDATAGLIHLASPYTEVQPSLRFF